MDDIISRQAALYALGDVAPEIWTDSPEEFAALYQWEMDVTAIEAVPSEEPKIGLWIRDDVGVITCSECGRPRRDNRINHIKYCNSCGARMKGW